jgi:hypothetical protein
MGMSSSWISEVAYLFNLVSELVFFTFFLGGAACLGALVGLAAWPLGLIWVFIKFLRSLSFLTA